MTEQALSKETTSHPYSARDRDKLGLTDEEQLIMEEFGWPSYIGTKRTE